MNESKQRSAHISQLIDAFIAIGGNQVVIQSVENGLKGCDRKMAIKICISNLISIRVHVVTTTKRRLKLSQSLISARVDVQEL